MSSSNGKDLPPIHYCLLPTPLGMLLGAQTEKGVCALFLADDSALLVAELHKRFPGREIGLGTENTEKRFLPLLTCMQHPIAEEELDEQGTPFQKKVWETLRTIPCGETRSYSEIAEAIGMPQAVCAVARACGANPISIWTPCHRVVRRDGGLGGYHWGLKRKKLLLEWEKKN